MRYIISIFILLAACKKVETEDVIRNLRISEKEVAADGQSTVSISVEITSKSSSDRRSVIFTCSSGSFTGSGLNKYTAKPEFENGMLIARATFKVPTQPGTIRIIVKPEFDDPLKEYALTDSIVAKRSIPIKLKLSASSFGIASNHLNEVLVTGTFENTDAGFVSAGYKVLFEDFLLNNSAARGQFREVQSVTTDSSFVKSYYSAFGHSVGTQIKIRGTLLDANGPNLLIADSVLITINQ